MVLPSDTPIHLASTVAGDVMVSEMGASRDVDGWNALEIDLPFPAVVRGLDANNCAFEEETVLERLSTHKLRLQLTRLVMPGSKFSVVIRLTVDPNTITPAPTVAVRARVLDIERFSDHEWRLTMAFRGHRFLYAT